MKRALIVVYALLLFGCWDEKALIQKFAPREDDELARCVIDLLREGRYDEINALLDPTVMATAGSDALVKLHQIIDHGTPVAFELIGANVGYLRPADGSAAQREASLVYQLQFPDAWVVATLTVYSGPKGHYLSSIYFQPVPDSLQVLYRFTLGHKSAIHYLFLTVSILIPIFMITTAVLCVRTRVRRRWLWVLFILTGFLQFRLNWTTGAWDIQPLSFNLLGAGFFRASSYAPVILSFALPVGATVFLICRSRLSPRAEPGSPPLIAAS